MVVRYIFSIVFSIWSLLLSLHGKPLENYTDQLSKPDVRVLTDRDNELGLSTSKNATDITEKRYFGLSPGFSYQGHAGEGGGGGGGGGGGCGEHDHLDDVEAIAGHEGFHASQHPHHHDCHHDDGHHAPAYGHSGGHRHDDHGSIEHSHHAEENPMMSHSGPGVHFHTGMVHMDAGGHLSRGGHDDGNIFTGIDSAGPQGVHDEFHDDDGRLSTSG